MTEEQIFEHLFRTHYQDLCQYAAHYVSDPQIVEDIVQGFFVTIWENKTLSANVHHFQSYAQRAIHNRCLNYYKAELSKENFLALFLEEWKEMQQERDEFPHKERIQAALHRLPPQCKRVFLLRCLKNMKYKEIADIAGISVNTVKYHLGEAFRLMHEELKDLLRLMPPVVFVLAQLF